MALFIFIGHDVANSGDARKKTRPAHLARLEALKQQGQLAMAGFMPYSHDGDGISGSVIVADFSDLAAAKAWADEEPYLSCVYSHVEVRPFVWVLP